MYDEIPQPVARRYREGLTLLATTDTEGNDLADLMRRWACHALDPECDPEPEETPPPQ